MLESKCSRHGSQKRKAGWIDSRDSSSLRRGERIQGAITAKQYAGNTEPTQPYCRNCINKAFDERLSDPLLYVAEQLMRAAEAGGSMRDG